MFSVFPEQQRHIYEVQRPQLNYSDSLLNCWGGSPTWVWFLSWMLAWKLRQASVMASFHQAWLSRGAVLIAIWHACTNQVTPGTHESQCTAMQSFKTIKHFKSKNTHCIFQSVYFSPSPARPAALDAGRYRWDIWEVWGPGISLPQGSASHWHQWPGTHPAGLFSAAGRREHPAAPTPAVPRHTHSLTLWAGQTFPCSALTLLKVHTDVNVGDISLNHTFTMKMMRKTANWSSRQHWVVDSLTKS